MPENYETVYYLMEEYGILDIGLMLIQLEEGLDTLDLLDIWRLKFTPEGPYKPSKSNHRLEDYARNRV